MQSTFSDKEELVAHTLTTMIQACDLIQTWNATTSSPDDYTSSPEGMKNLAATCMLIESIGEGVKKVDKIMPGFLEQVAPHIPWKDLKGMRDHIAHGYFKIDEEIVFDVAVNEIGGLKEALIQANNNL